MQQGAGGIIVHAEPKPSMHRRGRQAACVFVPALLVGAPAWAERLTNTCYLVKEVDRVMEQPCCVNLLFLVICCIVAAEKLRT